MPERLWAATWFGRAWCRWAGAAVAALLLIAGAPARAALVAHYTFDETGGVTAAPSVGSVNGSFSPGVGFLPGGGVLGGAVSLTGGLVNFGDNFGFPGSSFSVQVWVRTSDDGFPIGKHFGGIVSGYFLNIGNAGDGCGGAAGQVSFYVTYPCSGKSAQLVNDNQWHQLVGVYDAATTIASVYVDGVLATASGPGAASVATPSGTPFLLGGLTVSGTPTPLYWGLADELRIYSHALTAGEVAGLYASIPQAVPEPAALLLLATAALGLVAVRRAWEIA